MATKAYDITNSPQISKFLGAATKKTAGAEKAKAPPPTPPGWTDAQWKAEITSNPERAKQVAEQWGGIQAQLPSADPLYKPAAKPYSSPVPHDNRTPMDVDMRSPGLGEQTVSQHIDGLFGPTNSQGFVDKGSFNTPTASEGFYQQNQGAYQTPGAAENWWAQNQGQFAAPGAAEDFYAAHKGDLEKMPDPTNRAEEAYQAGKAHRPDIANDPGLEPYYNEAEARGTRQLNKRAASMGSYGSSVALGEVGNLVSGLEAEKANREADYNLKRIAEDRAWEQLGGEMASSADRSSLGISQNELSQLLGVGGLAQNAQQGSLSRLLGAAGASQGAQGAQTSRLNAGSSAAGQASNSELARQGLELNAANSADSQNRANTTAGMDAAFKSQDARENRVTGGLSSLSSTINAILGVTKGGQAEGISSDEAYRTALQAYDSKKVADAQAKADAGAQRDTAMWIQIFTTALAAI